MTTLAVNKQRKFEITGDEVYEDVPMVATDILYEGAAAGDSSGTARPLQTGDAFVGFCVRKADNSAGAASAISARIMTKGRIVLAVTGVASADDLGITIYATDDDTFTTDSSGSAVAIGKVVRWITSTTCVVAFEAAAQRSI